VPAAKRASSVKSTAKPKAASRAKSTGRGSSANGSKAKSSSPARRAREKPSADGSSVVVSTAYRRAERRARKVIKSPDDAKKLVASAAKKADEHSLDLGEAFEGLEALLRLIWAYAKGEYRDLPTKTMVAAAAAVVYFVNPVDLIPDVIPGVGYVDDAAVVFFVIKAISHDVERFREWEQAGALGPGRGGAGKTAKPSRKRKSPAAVIAKRAT